MSDRLHYFAYGSNMLTRRLARRVPSARPLGAARLPGHRIAFHKRGHDGSGKANITPTGRPDDLVHGVLFELAAAERPILDRIEGGYERRTIRVHAPALSALSTVPTLPDGAHGPVPALTYISGGRFLDDALLPFPWYKAFVVEGAREHGLPPAYVGRLAAVGVIRDPDPERARRNRAIVRPPGES
ncbi:MAG: gamma-glutamylcyclotransferase [Acidobacteriota bacterium]|jgi:hypothetical protein